jgi:hypothetical protein
VEFPETWEQKVILICIRVLRAHANKGEKYGQEELAASDGLRILQNQKS